MARHSTTLENATESLFEVRSESSSGVHTLLTSLNPGDSYKLVRGSSDTYLQHWVVVGDSPVVNFSSDELVDNERIKIVWNGTERKYEKESVLRYSSSRARDMSNEQRPQQPGSASLTLNTGKPPSGIKRFFSLERFPFARRSPDAAATLPTLRSTNSEPILESSVTSLSPNSSRHSSI